MMILAVQQPLIAVDMVLGTALFATRREKVWFRVLLLASFVNPVLNVGMVMYFQQSAYQNGAIGAAIVSVLTEIVMCAGAIFLLPRGTIDARTALLSLRIVLAGLGAALVTLAVAAMSLPLALVAGGATYLVLAAILRIVSHRDVQLLGVRLQLVRGVA
jgi:O-antigen/teichoic acid export membrane protein